MALTLQQKKLLRDARDCFNSDVDALTADYGDGHITREQYINCYDTLLVNYDNDVAVIRAGAN